MMATSMLPALVLHANGGIAFLTLISIIITAEILILKMEDHGVTIPTLSANLTTVGITVLSRYVNPKVRLIYA